MNLEIVVPLGANLPIFRTVPKYEETAKQSLRKYHKSLFYLTNVVVPWKMCSLLPRVTTLIV